MWVMPLDVRILGASQPLSAGRRYDLLCQSSGSRPPASITWTLDGQRLERTKETKRSRYDKHTLEIRNIVIDQQSVLDVASLRVPSLIEYLN
ncbi:hypothetical protein C0J52_03821 [Blattella germanica]|nr:hypothetical protein C0J52_03821 [Blattella germanica]